MEEMIYLEPEKVQETEFEGFSYQENFPQGVRVSPKTIFPKEKFKANWHDSQTSFWLYESRYGFILRDNSKKYIKVFSKKNEKFFKALRVDKDFTRVRYWLYRLME